MDRDTCIIAVYCVVVAHYQALAAEHPVRQGGCSPTLSDEAVIPMDICGEYFKLSADKDIWEYFRTHYRHFFSGPEGPHPVGTPRGPPLADQRGHPAAPGASQWPSHRPPPAP